MPRVLTVTALAASLVTTLACVEVGTAIEAPAGIAWVLQAGLVDPAGSKHGVLQRLEPGDRVPALFGARPSALLGWTEATMAPYLPDDRALVSSAPLEEAAATCAPTLPPADWSSVREGDVARALEARELPRLTAPWLSGCRGTADAILVDAPCSDTACARVVDGCEARITCGPVTFRAVIDRAGVVCADPAASGCAVVAPVAGAEASIRCPDVFGCYVDLYKRPEREGFDIVRSDLAPNMDPFPGGPVSRPQIPLGARFGRLTDLAVLPRAIAVVRHPERVDILCTSRLPSEIVLVDPETMQTTHTASAPPCLLLLERAHGASGGLIGLYAGEPGAVSLIRFSEDGRILARAGPLRLEEGTSSVPVDLVSSSAGTFALTQAFIQVPDPVGFEFPSHRVLALDPDTLTVTRSSSLPGHAWSLAIGERQLAVAAGPNVERLDLALEEAPVVDLLLRTRYATAEAIEPFHLGGDRFSALSAGEPTGANLVPREGAEDTQAIIFESTDLVPTAGARALDGSLVIGAVMQGPEYRTEILRFEVVARREGGVVLPRFLPGTTAAGRGPIRRMRTDASGRVWAILPWSGELLRITPR